MTFLCAPLSLTYCPAIRWFYSLLLERDSLRWMLLLDFKERGYGGRERVTTGVRVEL